MHTFLNVMLVVLAVVVGAICTVIVVYVGAIIAVIGSAITIGALLIFTAIEYVKYLREK